jgi:hypothetical protein
MSKNVNQQPVEELVETLMKEMKDFVSALDHESSELLQGRKDRIRALEDVLQSRKEAMVEIYKK